MDTQQLLGGEAEFLLGHTCKGIPEQTLTPDYIDDVMTLGDRPVAVLRNLAQARDHGRLGGTGYLSILPVDQGIEHSGAASFARNPAYFDPASLCQLALEGGCSAIATTLGVLGMVARRYAHRIPFIMKFNHNELLTYPSHYQQVRFASVAQAFDLGAVGVGATVYFGSADADRELQEVSAAFAETPARAAITVRGSTAPTDVSSAHRLGKSTVRWCYLRNPAFERDGVNHETAADLTGQASHLGVTLEADIIKQKQPTCSGGYTALSFGATDPLVYSKLTTGHPIDLTRWQVANCYLGRIRLINSGGGSEGPADLAKAVHTAVINKRAGGCGSSSGASPSSGPCPRAPSSSTPCRTSTSTPRSRWPEPWPAMRRAHCEETDPAARRGGPGLNRRRGGAPARAIPEQQARELPGLITMSSTRRPLPVPRSSSCFS